MKITPQSEEDMRRGVMEAVRAGKKVITFIRVSNICPITKLPAEELRDLVASGKIEGTLLQGDPKTDCLGFFDLRSALRYLTGEQELEA